MDEVTAKASEPIKLEFPKRPTFLLLHYTYSDGYWIASTPDDKDTPQILIDSIKENYYADIAILVHIPSETESAYLKRRAELLELLYEATQVGGLQTSRDGCQVTATPKLIAMDIGILDAEWKEAAK